MLPSKKNSIKECDTNSDNNSGSPDSELDSGISINGHYDQIERLRKNGLDYERIDEIKTMTGKVSKLVSIWSKILQLTVRSHDISQAEKKILLLQAEQIRKITITVHAPL